MRMADFIRDQILAPRLREQGALVVYDPEGRYRELCLEFASDRVRVVDAGASGLKSRGEASQALRELGRQGGLEGLLIHVPRLRPRSDEECQHDPFASYAVAGAMFPEDDGDEYLNLCLKARPDQATEIRRIFAAQPSPPFSVIDAVGGGQGWPILRDLLRADSARDILFALLAPAPNQQQALKGNDTWVPEARDLLKSTLGFALKSKVKAWSTISEELWRFLLFSEFAFDLPAALPDALASIPHAVPEARTLVEDLCDRLRDHRTARMLYLERAEAVEKELQLPAACAGIKDLGVRDTFPFEERTFLGRAIAALQADDLDTARGIVSRRARSVWMGQGEAQSRWGVVAAALHLTEGCGDLERQLPEHTNSQESLIGFYLASLREVDRLHREFEQAQGDALEVDPLLQVVAQRVRSRYRRLMEQVQATFMRHLESGGWPPSGRLANADVFTRLVDPGLQQSGRRVAYLLIDALRYELGVALEKLLAEDGPVSLTAAYANLPTVTPVGMASLLPDAGQSLHLVQEWNEVVPKLGQATVANVQARMAVLRERYGARFQEMGLADFLKAKAEVGVTTELLVLRSVEIDSLLESNPDMTLRLLPDTLSRIRAAVHKLRGLGFHQVVIATDHGFYLNAAAEAGDLCSKPSGNWPVDMHSRMLLGQGTGDAANLVMDASRLGIRCSLPQAALPRSMAPYCRGLLYFHGGASLQEAVVPVLTVALDTAQPEARRFTLELSYRGGAKRITTRVPVIEIAVTSQDLFSAGRGVEILLEAQDGKGHVVGEPRPGGPVDPATRTVSVPPDGRIQVTLRMADEFEGKFTVKAFDPNTLVTHATLSLETDYTV